MTAWRLAPAKVNLFLHVGPPDGEGYHPLVSHMVFAEVGDRLWLEPTDVLSMTVQGPFGAGLSAGEDNLVVRAARALLAAAGRDAAPYRLVLDKQLPLAAGLGGGSADAGAALRLLDAALKLGLGEAALEEIAAGLGADGAACFRARPVIAEGRGERLTSGPAWPALPCVLVNPGVPSPTGPVYKAYDAAARFSDLRAPVLPEGLSVQAAIETLSALRNDLETPAIALQPAIGEALAALTVEPEARLARMSGSGSTCFVLCDDPGAARRLALRLAARRPDWWVRDTRLA